MNILLTNDDGVYAPGLAALYQELTALGDVHVVAPLTEQSGVAHSITFLSPLVVRKIFNGPGEVSWGVEGSPADCVKLGLFECCPVRPDLVVSGINGGLNAGINVLYSGTVAAAIEGAFFGITSMAVSLEYDEHADFPTAAKIARRVLEQVLPRTEGPQLYNLNIPTVALNGPREIHVTPMGLARYGEHFIKRQDPKGRDYYWATTDPPPSTEDADTDLAALERGHITLTPLEFDLTKRDLLGTMKDWRLEI
ncbi:MAG: 5'/3'-nucleotidase SurE [Planctomycetales bacterium]|nr:5'/3'-nucleotidase SurE [Planctomycetales bacterium]